MKSRIIIMGILILFLGCGLAYAAEPRFYGGGSAGSSDPDDLDGDTTDNNLVDVAIQQTFVAHSGVTVDSGTTTITPAGYNIEYIYVTVLRSTLLY